MLSFSVNYTTKNKAKQTQSKAAFLPDNGKCLLCNPLVHIHSLHLPSLRSCYFIKMRHFQEEPYCEQFKN